jgi:hypothetical protein
MHTELWSEVKLESEHWKDIERNGKMVLKWIFFFIWRYSPG